jgi:dienelactone hydrolase
MIVETPILFPGGGTMLSGLVVRPASHAGQRYKAVIVVGSWLTVKEQMPLLYAHRLASLGYAALVFDFSGFGTSGGEPRQAEIPERKIGDLCAATAFVSTLSFVEPGQVGLVAICASAQYAQHAIARGAPIRAFASVAGWFHDAETIAPFYGGAEGVERRLGAARADLMARLDSGQGHKAPAYAPGDERAGMPFKLDYYGNPARGAVITWKNEMAPLTWSHWLTFDGLSIAGANTIPSLMVHGEGCALPDNARRVFQHWAGPKTLDWVEGEQTDFYDQPAQVDRSVAAIDRWFMAHLKSASISPAPGTS